MPRSCGVLSFGGASGRPHEGWARNVLALLGVDRASQAVLEAEVHRGAPGLRLSGGFVCGDPTPRFSLHTYLAWSQISRPWPRTGFGENARSGKLTFPRIKASVYVAGIHLHWRKV